MQKTDALELADVIGTLRDLLQYARKVYDAYHECGKKFCFARVLFDVNSRISELLHSHLHVIPPDSKEDAFALMFHIDVWMAIWVDECDRSRPHHDEVFTFPNEVTFPKESVERLLALVSNPE